METVAAIRSRRWVGRTSLLLQGLGPASGRPWRGLWSSEGSPGPPAHLPAPRREGLEGPRKYTRSSSHGPVRREDHREADCGRSRISNLAITSRANAAARPLHPLLSYNNIILYYCRVGHWAPAVTCTCPASISVLQECNVK